MSVYLIVPVYNPGSMWVKWMSAVQQQLGSVGVLVIDSSSVDGTDFSNLPADWKLIQIEAKDFNHGGTRNMALRYLPPNVETIIFMTQDALLAEPEALQKLLSAFNDVTVACAYGRQLPHEDATPRAAHARIFNYPADSRVLSIKDKKNFGLKTCFLSNSFAAYRLSDLLTVGGFSSDVILGEDMSVAARLLLAGKRVAYVSEACAYHSHNYTLIHEFRRYFDTGVFHAKNPWLLQTFGGVSGEGLNYILSELKYLWRNAPSLLLAATLGTFAKWIGYRLGRIERYLPVYFKRLLSMQREYWK